MTNAHNMFDKLHMVCFSVSFTVELEQKHTINLGTHTHTPHTHTHHTHTPHTHTHTLTHTHTHHTHSHTRIIDTENYILSTFHKTATTGVSVAAHFAPPNKI